jgi:hypothetical protein
MGPVSCGHGKAGVLIVCRWIRATTMLRREHVASPSKERLQLPNRLHVLRRQQSTAKSRGHACGCRPDLCFGTQHGEQLVLLTSHCSIVSTWKSKIETRIDTAEDELTLFPRCFWKRTQRKLTFDSHHDSCCPPKTQSGYVSLRTMIFLIYAYVLLGRPRASCVQFKSRELFHLAADAKLQNLLSTAINRSKGKHNSTFPAPSSSKIQLILARIVGGATTLSLLVCGVCSTQPRPVFLHKISRTTPDAEKQNLIPAEFVSVEV